MCGLLPDVVTESVHIHNIAQLLMGACSPEMQREGGKLHHVNWFLYHLGGHSSNNNMLLTINSKLSSIDILLHI